MVKEYSEIEWNMALATLMRMDKLMQEANTFQRLLDGENAYRCLRALYREVYPLMNTDEKKEAKEKLAKLIEEYNDLSVGKKKVAITGTMITALEDFDLFLRDCLMRSGEYMSKKEDPGMVMSRGD